MGEATGVQVNNLTCDSDTVMEVFEVSLEPGFYYLHFGLSEGESAYSVQVNYSPAQDLARPER